MNDLQFAGRWTGRTISLQNEHPVYVQFFRMKMEAIPRSSVDQSQKEVSFLLRDSVRGWKQRRMYLAMNSDLRPLQKFVWGWRDVYGTLRLKQLWATRSFTRDWISHFHFRRNGNRPIPDLTSVAARYTQKHFQSHTLMKIAETRSTLFLSDPQQSGLCPSAYQL
jgi:hypothetical protein